jgi:hypothetical protein
MKTPTASQVDAARSLLARGAQGARTTEERRAASLRACDDTVSHLATFLGSAGARAIFARSVRLTASDFPRLRELHLAVDGEERPGEQIEIGLRGETPEAVFETMVALHAMLLALLETLIGERLTSALLRDVWPGLRASDPKEETK